MAVVVICLSWIAVIHAQSGQNELPTDPEDKKEEEPEIITAPPHLQDSLDPYDTLPEDDHDDAAFIAPKPENVVRFEASDAVTPTTPTPPPSLDLDHPGSSESPEIEVVQEEDESTKVARELFETANGLLNASSSSNRKKAWDVMSQSADLGHPGAKVKIAWAKLAGVNYRQDLEAAKEIFDEVAAAGNPEAQMGLGFLSATGTLVHSSQAKALLYYTFGAFGGSPWAQMALGYRYWSGMGVATSCEKALDYYRRVAQSVAEEVSFSGGQTLQRIRLQDEIESGSYSSGER